MGSLTATALVVCIIMASVLVQAFVIREHGLGHGQGHGHGRPGERHSNYIRKVRNAHCSHDCEWTSCKTGALTKEAHGCGSGTHLCGSRECDGGFSYQCCTKVTTVALSIAQRILQETVDRTNEISDY